VSFIAYGIPDERGWYCQPAALAGFVLIAAAYLANTILEFTLFLRAHSTGNRLAAVDDCQAAAMISFAY